MNSGNVAGGSASGCSSASVSDREAAVRGYTQLLQIFLMLPAIERKDSVDEPRFATESKHDAAIETNVAARSIYQRDKLILLAYRQKGGVSEEEHIRALAVLGWTKEEFEDGKKR